MKTDLDKYKEILNICNVSFSEGPYRYYDKWKEIAINYKLTQENNKNNNIYLVFGYPVVIFNEKGFLVALSGNK